MNIYILRHAIAGVRRTNPKLDVKRGLVKEGKQQCMLVANLLNSLNVQVDAIASSPLKRAMQTASLVGTEMGFESKIIVTPALSFEGTLAGFQKLVDDLSKYDNVLLVGHNPSLQQYLSSLLTTNGGKVSIRLRKGAIARVDYTRRPGTLQWIVDPRILRVAYASVAKKSRRKTSRK
jgi:phosphohistidine phosphatase